VTLSKLLDRDLLVKWPNDVVTADGKKIAGILAESASSGGALSHIVVGIGLNVNVAEFPEELAGMATSCRILTGLEWDRADLLADVLGTIEAYYDRFVRDGFGALSSSYQARLVQADKRVEFERGGTPTSGQVQGIARDGALVVRLADGSELELYSEHVEVAE